MSNYLLLTLNYVIYFSIIFEKIKIFFKRRTIWHRTCIQISCQPDVYLQNFLNIIPENINPAYKISPADFTRDRELPFNKVITFTLSLTASGTNQGVDIKSGLFFKNAQRTGLWPDAHPLHRSSITNARQKVPYNVFSDILQDAVKVAYDLWPQDDSAYLWHGMSVYAADGSKFILPATDEIRKHFDPQSGLQNNGKGHYPQCLVSTLYDVYRRLPIARTVVSNEGSEREELKNLLLFVPPKSVWLFDRGYPSYETIQYLIVNYPGFFIFRSPATCTFPSVETFVKSGKNEGIIWITPSNKFKSKVTINERKKLKPVKLRIIRMESPDGTISVLLTNLFGKNLYKSNEILNLYYKRWKIEEYYRDEKLTLEIEKFHSRTVNGILQELYASMIMSVISRTLMILSSQIFLSGEQETQFKNAIITLASDAAFFVSDDPQKSLKIFTEILKEIARVKYYRPKEPRKSQPRVNKSPLNKWKLNKVKKAAENA